MKLQKPKATNFYSKDSLEAFSNGGEDSSSPETQDSEELAPVTPTLEGSPVSILRHRKNSGDLNVLIVLQFGLKISLI